MSDASVTLIAAQREFTAHLAAVEDAVRFAFRHRFRLRRQDYEEAMAESIAAAWSAWTGLIARGKNVDIGIRDVLNPLFRTQRPQA
jgi:hypothetical protein